MSTTNPITRETRSSAILVASAGQTVLPTSQFRIWDAVDVEVWRALAGGSDWQKLTEGYTVAKSGSGAFETFAVTLETGAAAGDKFVLISRRLHERLGDVTQGGTINTVALERELDRLATIQQEIYRDLGRALIMPPGYDGGMPAPQDGRSPIWSDVLGRYVNGPDLSDIASVQASATTATDASAAALTSRNEAEAFRDEAAGFAAHALNNFHVDEFAGDGAQTVFNLTATPGSGNNAFVFVDGISQEPSSYTLNATTLTFSEAPGGDGVDKNILVRFGNTATVGVPADGTITTNKLAAGAVTASKINGADLTAIKNLLGIKDRKFVKAHMFSDAGEQSTTNQTMNSIGPFYNIVRESETSSLYLLVGAQVNHTSTGNSDIGGQVGLWYFDGSTDLYVPFAFISENRDENGASTDRVARSSLLLMGKLNSSQTRSDIPTTWAVRLAAKTDFSGGWLQVYRVAVMAFEVED